MTLQTNLDPNTAILMFLEMTSRLESEDESLQTNNSFEEPPPEIPAPEAPKKRSKKIWKDVTVESSHTKFFKRPSRLAEFKGVTRDEYLGVAESVSGSADTFSCVHGHEGKQYTPKGLLKRNILKNLDPKPFDRKWSEDCALTFDWDIAKIIEQIVESPTVEHQFDRLQLHLRDFAKTSRNGYRVDVLHSYCVIMDYLLESVPRVPALKEGIMLLLKNLPKPILLTHASDVISYFEDIMYFMGFMDDIVILAGSLQDLVDSSVHIGFRMNLDKTPVKFNAHVTPGPIAVNGGALKVIRAYVYLGQILQFAYMLIKLDDDDQFDIVSKAMLFHLTAPDKVRGPGTVPRRLTLAAAAPVLRETIVRMVAVADDHRFSLFLEIVLLLACDTAENCIEMMQANIIEIIFYRFNPYFPKRALPHYDINPLNCQDVNVKLGDSSVNMSTTLSVLLVLLKTTATHLDENPGFKKLLPVPDCYAQSCFIWAYRYECRARDHRHERITLTVIAAIMIKCYGERLLLFSSILMPDIMSLSVLTELPLRKDWTATVNFNTSQEDVQFKKTLIHFVVYLLKVFPYNKFMMESQYWLLGIMYLLDPGLSTLRSRWSPALFAEIRKTALQALVCTIPMTDPSLIKKYALIRRIMWYIEWYSESPFEIPILYWCVRLLQVATHQRQTPERGMIMQDLFDTHGIVIIMNLCYTLMEQKVPPVEKCQAIIALSLRLLTSGVVKNQRVTCIVYPAIRWPYSVNQLARKMMDVVLYSLDQHFIVSDRWIISLLNFIWEAIIWNTEYRAQFVCDDGVYKLLDMITMTRAPVRCIALALVCDIARAGEAVGHLVSWRANLGASNANPKLVNRGATIATLLASLFREGCHSAGVPLNQEGVLQDLEFPVMSVDAQKELYNTASRCLGHRTPVCFAAAELAGSCMSKAFAILHMLSDDLEYKVSLADEAFSLYKNIKLATEDEVILVLCSHYLTLKLNETWKETQIQTIPLFVRDNSILEDFVNMGKGWAKEVKRQQEKVIADDRKRACEEESSLYAFLGRIRLNIALDALRTVRCVARSTDHNRISHLLLHDAVFAHHRCAVFADKTNATLLRTYKPPLDDQNITGQNVKVTSIPNPSAQDRYISEKDDLELGCECGCGEYGSNINYTNHKKQSHDIMELKY